MGRELRGGGGGKMSEREEKEVGERRGIERHEEGLLLGAGGLGEREMERERESEREK